MIYNEVTWSRFVDRDMVMRFYLGHAVGHTYTHGPNLPLPVGTTRVMPEYEDIDIVLVPSDRGDSEESSSGSEEDSETSTESDAMDVDEDESEESEDMDADN